MNTEEAFYLLRKHNGEFLDEPDAFLNSLRPYTGIKDSHFWEIVKALYFAAPMFTKPHIDRDLIHCIWDLTRCARLWTKGPHEPMFHGRHFISPEDKATLDQWINTFESITLYLLRGFSDWEAIGGIAEKVNHQKPPEDSNWLIAPFMSSLEYHLSNESDGILIDDIAIISKALGKLGPAAIVAIPLLQKVVSNSKNAEATFAAKRTIAVLEADAAT